MRHRRSRTRLSGKPAHVRMVARNLVTSLLLYESVRTTHQRARIAQRIADRLIAIAKRKNPREAIRAIGRTVTDPNASRKLLEVLAVRYHARPSGFTRMVKVGSRKGDGAALVDISLVDSPHDFSPASPSTSSSSSSSPSS